MLKCPHSPLSLFPLSSFLSPLSSPLLIGICVDEDSVPAYLAASPLAVLVKRDNHKHWCSHDVILRNKAPESRVERVVAVIAHHPVVVHLEGVLRDGLAVDVGLATLNLKVGTLIVLNAASIELKILLVEVDAGALLWNPDGAVVVMSPSVVHSQRIGANTLSGTILCPSDTSHPVALLKLSLHFGGER